MVKNIIKNKGTPCTDKLTHNAKFSSFFVSNIFFLVLYYLIIISKIKYKHKKRFLWKRLLTLNVHRGQIYLFCFYGQILRIDFIMLQITYCFIWYASYIDAYWWKPFLLSFLAQKGQNIKSIMPKWFQKKGLYRIVY